MLLDSLYFILVIGSMASVAIFSFNPNHSYRQVWWDVIKSSFVVAIPFLIWDDLFTRNGIWGFNQDFLLGINFSHLPLEEVLFFFAIPFASLFIYFSIIYFFKPSSNLLLFNVLTILLSTSLLVIGLWNYEKLYTSITFISMAIWLIIMLIRKVNLSRYYFSYAIILIPFLIVNGILTGAITDSPVVWYNNDFNLGIRIITIPVEDIFYGMLLIFPTIFIMEQKKEFKNLSSRKEFRT